MSSLLERASTARPVSKAGEPAAALRLRAFGPPVIATPAGERPLPPERGFQLLAYLACRDDWVPREELSGVFWEEVDRPAARRNLRRVLFNVRRFAWLEGFEVRDDAVRWRVASDLSAFDAAWSAGDWRQCIALGGGTLFEGFEVGVTDRYHEWLAYEREQHLRTWRLCVSNVARELEGDPKGRVELALQVLRHDPLNEDTVRDLIAGLTALGRHDEAQVAHRSFLERARRELGVEPTVRLDEPRPAEQHRYAEARAPGLGPASRLVGRRLELIELARMVTTDARRRVTLHGPGGVGKSSLARALLDTLEEVDFRDGMFWVDLADLADASQVPGRIAEACGWRLPPASDRLAELAGLAAGVNALLVLDNCEHLAGLAKLDDYLLRRCPGLALLHTSRSRVGCEDEHLYPLPGLATPDPEETDPEVLATFDSMRLFEICAQRADPRFDASGQRVQIASLVRRLEGLPLAIELAAASAQYFDVAAIERDIGQLVDVPARGEGRPETTLRASFERSWNLLSDAERAALAGLTVFESAFTAEAAHHIAEAALTVISALADKSLVKGLGRGRFAMHPLVRQLARLRLGDADASGQRHAAYFAELLVAHAKRGAPPWTQDEIGSCLQAWRWASAAKDVTLLQRMARPLIQLFNAYVRWHEGSETLGLALAGLEGDDARTEELRAVLLQGIAYCQLYSLELVECEDTARRALRICARMRLHDLYPATLVTAGFSLAWRGEVEPARHLFRQCLRAAKSRLDAETVARARHGLALIELQHGSLEAARELYEENEAYCDAHGLSNWRAMTANGLGRVALAAEDNAEAIAHFDRSIALCESYAAHGRTAVAMAGRASALVRSGRLAEGEPVARKALLVAHEWPSPTPLLYAQAALCEVALARGEVADALPVLERLVELSRPWTTWRYCVIGLAGEVLAAAGEQGLAAATLRLVATSALAANADRARAKRALERLSIGEAEPASRMGADQVEAALSKFLRRAASPLAANGR